MKRFVYLFILLFAIGFISGYGKIGKKPVNAKLVHTIEKNYYFVEFDANNQN